MGFEPMTSSLPMRCSASELRRPNDVWSGKRDSNPRPSAWKADALPTELFPLTRLLIRTPSSKDEGDWMYGGEWWIRTTVDRVDRFTACSL